MTKRTIYFEGAGCVPVNDVENCRIRTAFTNNEGKKIYIEFIAGCRTLVQTHTKSGKELKKPRYITQPGFIWCDYCFYITEDPAIDDCNRSRLSCERNTPAEERKPYTKANLLDFINKKCNASFTDLVVLNEGFRVFADCTAAEKDTPKAYNFSETVSI